MEEQDYFEALSLEGPEAGSAPAQVEAETAGPASDEGRAPAEAPEGMPPETEQAIRAAAEQARREAQEQFKAQEQSFFARVGMKDPYRENRRMESFEDFEQWYARSAQKDGASEQTQRSEPAADPAQQAQFQKQVDYELAQIRKLDPGIHGLEDILKSETGAVFANYVQQNNLSYLEAFQLANAGRLAQRRAARQRTQSAAASKDHLAPLGGGTGELSAVPKEVMELYRAMDPSLSTQQIQREYNKWYR